MHDQHVHTNCHCDLNPGHGAILDASLCRGCTHHGGPCMMQVSCMPKDGKATIVSCTGKNTTRTFKLGNDTWLLDNINNEVWSYHTAARIHGVYVQSNAFESEADAMNAIALQGATEVL